MIEGERRLPVATASSRAGDVSVVCGSALPDKEDRTPLCESFGMLSRKRSYSTHWPQPYNYSGGSTLLYTVPPGLTIARKEEGESRSFRALEDAGSILH